LKSRIAFLETKLNETDSQIFTLEEKRCKIQRFNIIKIKKPRIKLQFDFPKPTKEAKKVTPVEATQRPVPKFDMQDKIIVSNDLRQMEYKALNFQSKWKDFFGMPSVTFHCVIHGRAGEGKSTFAAQFAYYLAENFGTVIYISGEEGFSKTLKDRFMNNQALSKYLYIADLHSKTEIEKQVPINTFNFIVIDSLDNMNIGIEELREIRKRYNNSAILTISQSTKDGKMRGSNELVHDCDIAVSVERGIATTIKNRFKEKYQTYQIFEPVNENNRLKVWNVV